MPIIGGNVIGRRVMAVVKSKIATAQKEYDEECKRLDLRAKEDKKAIEENLKAGKEETANKLVQAICGKFI